MTAIVSGLASGKKPSTAEAGAGHGGSGSSSSSLSESPKNSNDKEVVRHGRGFFRKSQEL